MTLIDGTERSRITHDNYTYLPLWLEGLEFSQCLPLCGRKRRQIMNVNCPLPPAYCMIGLLACSEAYEFGQLGTGLSGLH